MFVSNGKMTDAPPIGGSLPDVPRELSTRIVRSWLPRATRDGAAPLCGEPAASLFGRFRQGLPNKVQKRAVSDLPNDAPRSGTAAPRLRVQSQHKQKGPL